MSIFVKLIFLTNNKSIMARADFAWVNFDSRFTATNTEETRQFNVDGQPIGTGYLLIQALDIDRNQGHRIQINDRDLPSFDLPTQEGNGKWSAWMDRIPSGYLRSGPNTIKIIRHPEQIGGTFYVSDDFYIGNVAIHWREAG
jgi:hypothetical protein